MKTVAVDPRLLSSETAEFDRGLQELGVSLRKVDRVSFAVDAATLLSSQTELHRRECDRRIRLVLGRLGLDHAQLTVVVTRLRDPKALNALRGLLPEPLRHLAVQNRGTTTSLSVEGTARPPEPPSVDQSALSGRFFAVALIGTAEEHVNNEPMLLRAGLQHLRILDFASLWNLGSTGLCGFVVAPSAWFGLTTQEQNDAVRRLCALSTFMFVRVSLDGLHPLEAARFAAVAAEVRCGPLDGRRFCHGQDCRLTPTDVETLRSTAALLTIAEATKFVPLGIGEGDAGILRLIASDRHRPENQVAVRPLGTRELAGGRSGARLYLLSDGASQPFVAKIHTPVLLADELRRYQQWIAMWETNITNPILHSHLGATAISYRLQAAADIADAPAPTLEAAVDKVREQEWLNDVSEAEGDDVFAAIVRAASQLKILNSKKATGAPDDFWLDWPSRDLAKRGVDVILESAGSGAIRLSALIEIAVKALAPHHGEGLVHGDIHGRNILLVDRLPAFIDFAKSGPGHPLVDLARLDGTIRSPASRLLTNEQDLADLYRSLYVDGEDVESILKGWPSYGASRSCRLAIRSAVKIRKTAHEVSERHGIDKAQYLAMTCVISGWLLVNKTPGSGVERALLTALAPVILH